MRYYVTDNNYIPLHEQRPDGYTKKRGEKVAQILSFTILFLAISLVVALEMIVYKTIERIRKSIKKRREQ